LRVGTLGIGARVRAVGGLVQGEARIEGESGIRSAVVVAVDGYGDCQVNPFQHFLALSGVDWIVIMGKAAQVEWLASVDAGHAVYAVKAKAALQQETGIVVWTAAVVHRSAIPHLVLVGRGASLSIGARRAPISHGRSRSLLEQYDRPVAVTVCEGLILLSRLTGGCGVDEDVHITVGQVDVVQGNSRILVRVGVQPKGVIAQSHRGPGSVPDLDSYVVWIAIALVIHIFGEDQAGRARAARVTPQPRKCIGGARVPCSKGAIANLAAAHRGQSCARLIGGCRI